VHQRGTDGGWIKKGWAGWGKRNVGDQKRTVSRGGETKIETKRKIVNEEEGPANLSACACHPGTGGSGAGRGGNCTQGKKDDENVGSEGGTRSMEKYGN